METTNRDPNNNAQNNLSLNEGGLELKKVIDDLIQTATSYDIETLDRIYHDDLQVIMYDISGTLNIADKSTFKEIFRSKKESGAPPMNTWAEYHHIQADEKTGHALLSRKNDLSGQPQILTLSIDLIFEGDRWQVLREVILLRPDNSNN